MMGKPQETWTAAEFQEWLKSGKKKTPNREGHKYGAQQTEYNGRKYPSKAEADYSAHLDLMKKAGEVKKIGYQYKVELKADDGTHICNCYIDFRVTLADGRIECIEVKGKETPDYKIKKPLIVAHLRKHEPGVDYVVIKRKKSRFYEAERYENKKI